MDKVMNVRVPYDLYVKVKAEADKDERTIHYVIRLALKEYFERRTPLVDDGVAK